MFEVRFINDDKNPTSLIRDPEDGTVSVKTNTVLIKTDEGSDVAKIQYLEDTQEIVILALPANECVLSQVRVI